MDALLHSPFIYYVPCSVLGDKRRGLLFSIDDTRDVSTYLSNYFRYASTGYINTKFGSWDIASDFDWSEELTGWKVRDQGSCCECIQMIHHGTLNFKSCTSTNSCMLGLCSCGCYGGSCSHRLWAEECCRTLCSASNWLWGTWQLQWRLASKCARVFCQEVFNSRKELSICSSQEYLQRLICESVLSALNEINNVS